MHLNSGYPSEAATLSEGLAEAFAGSEAVVSPSACCVGMVREHGDPGLASRTWELCEFVTGRLGVEDVGASYPHRVTYHPTCHSLRGLRVGDAPLRLCARSGAWTCSSCRRPRSAAASAARSP